MNVIIINKYISLKYLNSLRLFLKKKNHVYERFSRFNNLCNNNVKVKISI